jgi:hypothetical protein
MSKHGMSEEHTLGTMPAFDVAAVEQLCHYRYQVRTTRPDCCAPLDCIGGSVPCGGKVTGPDKQQKWSLLRAILDSCC